MTVYEPGTVAVATVRGVPNVRVFRHHERNWISAEPVGESRLHANGQVTDVRPLVVLDLQSQENAKDTAALLREIIGHWPYGRTHYAGGTSHLTMLAEQIEAQTRPPRIPEPGLWGVVSARLSRADVDVTPSKFIRDALRKDHDWTEIGTGNQWAWSDLIDPIELRPGATGGAK